MEQDQQPQSPQPPGGPETLERLLAWHAHRSPGKLALIDPANRDIVQNPSAAANERSYSFAALDRAVSRLAARFIRNSNLHQGDYVAVRLPNLSEAYVVMLALMRARLVPCMMPLIWDLEQISRAFERLKPVAALGCGRLDGIDHSHLLRDVASNEISVRHLFGVGLGLAEGFEDIAHVIENDDSLTVEATTGLLAPGVNELALITFVDPVTCVPHSHGQLLAGGLLHVKELCLTAQDRLLSAYAPSSLVSLSALVAPWLITGSTLILHHPLDKDLLQRQITSGGATFLAGPEPLVALFLRGARTRPAKLAIVWRHGHMPGLRDTGPQPSGIFDLWNLGEIGLVPTVRRARQPAGLFPGGRICLPGDEPREMCLAAGEVVDGSLHIRGRIFPNPALVGQGIEWFGFRKLVKDDMIDVGIAAFEGPGDSIFIGDGDVNGDQRADAAAE